METKFHLLTVGQHFEWEGKSYVKTTPLLANQVPEGGQKFIPRAALVKVADSVAPTPPAEKPASLDCATVRNAITRCHQRCVEITDRGWPQKDDTIMQLHNELEQIYRDLLT